MALDKLVDSSQLNTDLTSIANAIRTKGGTSASLAFPQGFVDAIDAIETGGGYDVDSFVSNPPVYPDGNVITLEATSIRQYAFAYIENGNKFKVFGPNVTYINQNAFRQCRMLEEAHFPALTSFHATNYIFTMPTSGTRSLTLVDWGKCNISGHWVDYCANLKTIILRKTTIATLGNVSQAFAGTPFASGGSGGSIYIPKVLFDHLGDGSSSDYKAATNWSTVDGYGTITWAKIEGSQYENPNGD